MLVFLDVPVPDDGEDLINWATVIISLVTGLLGGVVGALITSGTQKKLARDAASATAAQALWNFQRSIRDFASEAEAHEIRDGSYFTKTTKEQLEAARQVAYPFRGYLGDGYEHLVDRSFLGDYDPQGDPMDPIYDWFEWSEQLERRLKAVFKTPTPRADTRQRKAEKASK